ncbi:MAG: hypothetical protein V1790_00825 [Planctomycetota bacterium]
MAFTIDLTVARARAVFGNRRQTIGKITGPTSYTTGGEALAAGDVALGKIEYFAPTFIQTATAMVMCVYNYTTAKLQAFWCGTLTPAGSVVVTMTDGSTVVSYAPGGGDIKGSGNTDAANADANALVTNGELLYADTGFSVFVATMTPVAEPDVARNVCITIHNASGGALNLYEGVTTFTVTGTWRGTAQTEAITLTSTAGNKAVANTKFRVVYGSKPFDIVTQVAVTNPPINTFNASVGIGSKLGLPINLDTPAEADVLKITKNAADLPVSGTVNTTNNTVNLGTLADGDDVGIVYKADYDGAAGTAAFTGTPTTAAATAEVGSGQNLSTYSGRFEVIGN